MNAVTQQLEAILFVNPKGISRADLIERLEWTKSDLQLAIKELTSHLKGSGIELVRHDDQLQLAARRKLIPTSLSQPTRVEPLSSSALEVLAIVAHQQPITKDEIAQLRGVNSEQSLRGLIEKQLVEGQKSKKSGINYTHYVTTDKFLHHVGLRSLADLPKMGK